MKKKILLIVLIAAVAAAGLSSQSLQNNEYYRKSVELTRLSQEAFDQGEYELSERYAIEAQQNAALSQQYIDQMALAYRARTSLYTARVKMEMADRINLKNREPETYAQAANLFKQAGDLFNADDFTGSLEASQSVIRILDQLNIAGSSGSAVKAKYYEVKLKPNDRDCFWKIAGFDFVYGDPRQWKTLYEYNKNKLQDPNNPGLIQPGLILEIPSLKGEARSGQR